MSEYRVDELARLGGTTVRNVRAYQERGLLPPPRRQGRVALYDDDHLARLRVVGRLLDRGYTITNIAEMLGEWEAGRDLGGVLGLEGAVTNLWSETPTRPVTTAELARLFGAEASSLVEGLVEAGLLVRRGRSLMAPSPRVLAAAGGLVSAGIPLSDVLALAARILAVLDDVAGDLVGLIVLHLVDGGASAARNGIGRVLPDDAAVSRTASALRELAPAVTSGIVELTTRALERHSADVIGERAARLLAGPAGPSPAGPRATGGADSPGMDRDAVGASDRADSQVADGRRSLERKPQHG